MTHYVTHIMEAPAMVVDLWALFADEPLAFLLDSSRQGIAADQGRYSFIGCDPFEIVRSTDAHALEDLREKFQPFKERFREAPTPLVAGIVGVLSYDYGLAQEGLVRVLPQDLDLPWLVFGFYDCILTLDHWTQQLIITSTGWPCTSVKERQQRAHERLKSILDKLKELNGVKKYQEKGVGDENVAVEALSIQANWSPQGYQHAVDKALDHIAEGDIYQVNVAQRFEVPMPYERVSMEALYRRLRQASPSALGGIFYAGDFCILSTSPERFLSLHGQQLQTRPMKGTRPRGKDALTDAVLRQEIENSEKEKAELLMITDLHRNDLGRVCEFGSVTVAEARCIETYTTVFQATSTIEGVLREEYDAFDAIQACFPGGSITGCPKIRSMTIIESLEPVRRHFYTGIMGYVSFSGDMDFSVLIRMMMALEKKLYFYVGSGIVADSSALDEYNETLIKAQAMRLALASMGKMKT